MTPLRRSRTGRVHGRARLLPGADSGAAASRTSARPPGAARRAAGLLGIAGLTATATIGFGTAAMAAPSPSSGTSEGTTPTATAPSMSVSLAAPESVRSGAEVTYTARVNIAKKGDAAKLVVRLVDGTGKPHELNWSGCDSVISGSCVLKAAPGTRAPTATLTAPKVDKDTAITLAARVTAENDDGDTIATETSNARTLTVKKKPEPTKSPTPTPTKTAKPTPTKTSKPTPTKSHRPKPPRSHKPAKTSSHPAKHHSSHSSHPSSSTPIGNGHVPLPTDLPGGVPTGDPTTGLDLPNGKQSPFPLGSDPTSTGVPRLPTVAPSPEGSARTPNVAEPRKRASGLVHGDAVSVPAAAAAAFIGLGAGTLITRAVRRRGLWHPVGRHRE